MRLLLLSYDSFGAKRFANFGFHRNSAAGNVAKGNDVGAMKNGRENVDWFGGNDSVERAEDCRDDSYFGVNFDGN